MMMPLSAWPLATAAATRAAISGVCWPPRSSKGKPFWPSHERTCSFSSVPSGVGRDGDLLPRGHARLVVGRAQHEVEQPGQRGADLVAHAR